MKSGARPFGRGGRGRHLRRVSPEKARSGATAPRRSDAPQLGEKVAVAVAAGVVAVLAVGLGEAQRLRARAARTVVSSPACA